MLGYELLNNDLEHLSCRTQNTLNELQLVKRHIDGFKSQLTKRDKQPIYSIRIK